MTVAGVVCLVALVFVIGWKTGRLNEPRVVPVPVPELCGGSPPRPPSTQ